ncbi:12095_t:CDS:10 [Ambispora gerdemannii]|uniref:Folliculin n=1 Tax=Ambispora gerdemannii TaxID=144530 RepID=A0A9N9BX53_9GLOM|nr:12095_t:CDS:10 [Ambispora gerdemannii]
MTTLQLSKPRSSKKSKRRSMPARVGDPERLLEDDNPPTLPPLELSSSDHHILDLMLNESCSELDLGIGQSSEARISTEQVQETELSLPLYNNNTSDVNNNRDSLEVLEPLLSPTGRVEINNVLLSQDVIESLNTVKHVSLMALDNVLRQIVADDIVHSSTPSLSISLISTENAGRWRRRALSDIPTRANPTTDNNTIENMTREDRDAFIRSQILADIAQNATKLGSKSEMQEFGGRDSLGASSDLIKLAEIQNQLEANSPIIPSDDYSLACTLAALLENLYRILELVGSPQQHASASSSPSSDAITNANCHHSNSHTAEEILQTVNDENLYATLRNEVTNLQNRHSDFEYRYSNDVFDERIATWNEIRRLMEVVSSFCRDRLVNDPPPKYTTTHTEYNERSNLIDPPKYSSLLNNNNNYIGTDKKTDYEKTQQDFDNVLSAIERVYDVAPQLTNQRVELNNRQAKQMSAAILTSTIQRLSRGRYEEQRASSNSVVKYQTLNKLVEQINKSASRSFVDQRVELSPRQIRHFEVAKLNGVIEKLGKNRMTNQDWHPPEQLLVRDLTRLVGELSKSNHATSYASQRFQLSAVKERDMFMNSVLKKVEKMGGYRLDNQDADPPAQRRGHALQEIEGLMEKLSHRTPMNNQLEVDKSLNMNAIVALVHFCEVEGPSVIFCTQAFHDNNKNSSEDLPLDSSHSDNSSSCASCAFILPEKNYPIPKNNSSTTTNTEFKGFKTEDDDNPLVAYIGSRYPQHPQLYSIVRQACVRSLSCEFCQGREGPVLFGDEKNGYVLSYMFKIKDSQARGSHRFYSFIFLMTDRVYLVASWPFLVSKFRILATSLQSKASQVFDKEKAARERQDDPFMSRTGPLPQTSPGIWILKAGGRRLQERQVHGETLSPELHDFTPKSIGFFQPNSNINYNNELNGSSSSLFVKGGIFLADSKKSNSELRINNLPHLQSVLGISTFRQMVFNYVRGNQLIIQGSNQETVKSIVAVVKDLIPRKCYSAIEYDHKYHNATECNLLGLSDTAKIPENVNTASICLLDILFHLRFLLVVNASDKNSDLQIHLKYGTDEKAKTKEPQVNKAISTTTTSITNKLPNLYMDQLIEILETNLAIELLEMRLIIFKEQWLCKAQQFLRYLKFGAGSVTSGVSMGVANGGGPLPDILNSNNNAVPTSSIKQIEFLKQLNVDEHDLPIIKFWTGYYRNGC